MSLPEAFNSPASAAFDSRGNTYFTSPNFHNEVLLKAGEITAAQAPTIGQITPDNQLRTWYTFTEADMSPVSGKLAPMGIAFGPDGNAYVADMQMWFAEGSQSRVLRLVVENGQVQRTEVVVEGMTFPNALVWKGSHLFVSDTVLASEPGAHTSGVYRFDLLELDGDNPVRIAPYVSAEEHDPHLFETFVSSGKLNFGANGLAIDGEGHLYTAIMEDGSVMKTTLRADNSKGDTQVFAKGMIATDGMSWDPGTQALYIADLFANAVYRINRDGSLVLLAQNGDTNGANGELDAPSEVIVRGTEVIVMNFDSVFDSDEMINSATSAPFTLSVIRLLE